MKSIYTTTYLKNCIKTKIKITELAYEIPSFQAVAGITKLCP